MMDVSCGVSIPGFLRMLSETPDLPRSWTWAASRSMWSSSPKTPNSRAILPDARRRYPGLVVVNVTAPVEILAKRLAGRGRESEEALKDRLARGAQLAVEGEDVIVLDNSGAPGIAGARLVEALLGCRPGASAGDLATGR